MKCGEISEASENSLAQRAAQLMAAAELLQQRLCQRMAEHARPLLSERWPQENQLFLCITLHMINYILYSILCYVMLCYVMLCYVM